MKKLILMLIVMLASVCNSCTKNEGIVSEEKVKLFFYPKLEVVSSPLSRTINEKLYAIYIEKVIDGESYFYSQGVFTDPSLMLLKADKGVYNIYCTVIDKKYFDNSQKLSDWGDYYPFYTASLKMNTFSFTNEPYYLGNGYRYTLELYKNITSSELLSDNEYIYNMSSSERYYTEIKNLQVSSDKNIELDMKYMVFGVKLNGTNLGKGRTLKLHIDNSERDLEVNSKDSVKECLYVVPNNLSEWYNDNNKTDSINCTFSINGSVLLTKKIEIKRKELFTFNVNCSSFNFKLEDSNLEKENIFNY